MNTLLRQFLVPAALLLCTSSLRGGEVDMRQLQQDAVDLLTRYLRVDTTNPPGNESRAVDFFAEVLKNEGIPFETAEKVPGRGNLWAR